MPLSVEKQFIGQLPHTQDYEICTLRPGNPLADRSHDLTQVVFKYHPYIINKLDVGEDEVFSVNASPDGHIWTEYHNGVIQVLQRLPPAYRIPFAKRTDCATAGKLRREGIFAIHFDIKGNMDGTNGNGVYLIDKMQVRHFTMMQTTPLHLPFDKVFDIVADRNADASG